jgi:GT2 family glycosyltransferase
MILRYHSINTQMSSPTTVTIDTFERQLNELVGRQFAYLDEYDSTNPRQVVLTINEPNNDVLRFAIPLLRAREIPFELCFKQPHNSPFDANELELVKRSGGRISNWTSLPVVDVLNHTRLSPNRTSVIITSHNYAMFLTESVESVVRQIQPADEILLIDDASTDGSQEIAKGLGRKFPEIHIHQNPQNLGIVENFRKAVSLTSGDFVCFLGADNRMRADYIQLSTATLERHPQVGVAYTDMILFGHRSTELATAVGAIHFGESVLDRWSLYRWSFPEPTNELISQIRNKNFIHGSSMFRRAAYDSVGGFRHTDGPEDTDLFARILAGGWTCKRIPEALIDYRQHSKGQANSALSLRLTAADCRSLGANSNRIQGLRRTSCTGYC